MLPGGFMGYAHGEAGLGQVGGLVVCHESGYGLPTMVLGMVVATDRDEYPAAGYAEVAMVGRENKWVPDICLVPVVAM
jgi:hypothetical protein